jgi:membrane protease YdiL (CAAX protease family)
MLPAWGLPFYLSLNAQAQDYSSLDASRLLSVALVTFVLLCGFIAALQVCVVGLPLSALQPRSASLRSDLLDGLKLLGLLYLGVFVLQYGLRLFLDIETPESLKAIAAALSRDGLLLAVFLGPVIWLQAAVTEELTRAFLLSRLGGVWQGERVRQILLIALALLFGLGHAYQGWVGVLGTAYIGYVLGAYYLRQGRLLPVILAHGLYDTLSVLALVALTRSGSEAML